MNDVRFESVFDDYYYAHDCGRPYQRDEGWLEFFDRIAERIVGTINPKTVLDAGCAWGFLVEALREHGIEAWGIDISEYAIEQVHETVKPYCRVASLTEPLMERYDLIVSIEVLEHIPSKDADLALDNLCQASDDILFSSTPFDYKEATHINVQPPEFWSHHFALRGFFRDLDYDAAYITPWATRYQRKEISLSELVRDYERRFFQLWKENTDIRQRVIEQQGELSLMEKRRRQLEALEKSLFWRIITWLKKLRLKIIPPKK